MSPHCKPSRHTRRHRSGQTRGRGVAAVLVLLSLVGLGLAATAGAQPQIPLVPDCKDAPLASLPGTGIPGAVDPAPDPLPTAADPFASGSRTTIYDQYGYAGLVWNTYDLGCGGSVRDMSATFDTTLGNAFLSTAVASTAVTNGLHNRIARPQTYMAPLDSAVDSVTMRLSRSIWSPWGAVALLGVGALLLGYSARGQFHTVTTAAAWAVFVLALVAGLTQYPSRAAQFFDAGVTDSIGAVNSAAAGVTSLTGDPARAQGALLVENVLYDAWLRGTFGSSTSAAAKRWGPTLFQTSTLTWHEAADIAGDQQQAAALTDAKAQRWKETTALIAEQDPMTYAAIQGKAGGRGGAGFLALMGTIFTGLFRLIADVFLFAGLVMLRLVIMFLPAVAVVGLLAPMASLVRRLITLAAASCINVVAFAAGSTIHTSAVTAILQNATDTGMTVMALILCLVVTLAAFVVLYPLLSFGNILGRSRSGTSRLRRLRRQLVGYAVQHHAIEHGITEGANHAKKGAGTRAGEVRTGGDSPAAVDRPEGFTRRERQRRAAPRALPGPDERTWSPTGWIPDPPEGWPPGGSWAQPRPRLSGANTPPEAPRRPRLWVAGRPEGAPPGPGRPEVLEGTVVDHPADRPAYRTRPVHDANTALGRNGIGYSVYDPETRQTRYLDPDEPTERAS